MTGPAQGVIGAEPQAIIKRSKEGLPIRISPLETGKGQLNGIILEISNENNKPVAVKRIFIRE